jgi:L-lactate dehydrogenase
LKSYDYDRHRGDIMVDRKTKISVIGAGEIGATILYTLMLKNLADELVLYNRNKPKADAKAADIYHCTGLSEGPFIQSGDMEDTSSSDIVIITAGVLPEEDGSRTDVLEKNISIYKRIIPEIISCSPSCVLIVLTNPVDVMAYAAMKLSGIDPSRVIGTGTLLDTIRLRRILADRTGTKPQRLDSLVIGEHGDCMIPLWGSSAALDEDIRHEVEDKTRRAGWDIRLAKQHSCYAISSSAVRIVEAILGRDDSLLPVSIHLSGQYGIKGIYLSLPALLGSRGVRKILEPELDHEQVSRLKAAADKLDEFFSQADRHITGNVKEMSNEI